MVSWIARVCTTDQISAMLLQMRGLDLFNTNVFFSFQRRLTDHYPESKIKQSIDSFDQTINCSQNIWENHRWSYMNDRKYPAIVIRISSCLQNQYAFDDHLLFFLDIDNDDRNKIDCRTRSKSSSVVTLSFHMHI